MSTMSAPVSFRFAVTIVIEPDGELFHAFCPGLKGLHVDGRSEGEALLNATEAAQCYIASLLRHGDLLPIGPHFSAEGEEEVPHIPKGAFLRHIELQWPTRSTSGNS